MAYRKNVSDKEQVDMEQFCDKGGQSLSWWKDAQTAKRVQMPRMNVSYAFASPPSNFPRSAANYPAVQLAYYPLAAQRNVPSQVISHNDKPWRFENPGKA
jgi:hypothetical protein